MKQFGPATPDAVERQHALRRDIARLRRRLDRRANRLLAPTMIVGNCCEYFARYPGRSILVAACVGSFMWGRLPQDWNIRAGAARIKKWMVGTFWEELWQTVKQAVAVEPCRDSKNGREEQHV
ncbi:MAG: hypothetical protein VX346_13105 [Planctomycetota bacterium]|nr:hypothetical protein [Planctomycetota bacterium]